MPKSRVAKSTAGTIKMNINMILQAAIKNYNSNRKQELHKMNDKTVNASS
jgi:hypothetical protein